ncbi:MAG: HU family DNA-binding protein [Bdellovibrionota bacterium]
MYDVMRTQFASLIRAKRLTGPDDRLRFAPLSEISVVKRGIVNKAELVEKVSKKTELTKMQSEQVIDAALDVITKAVAKGDEVKLVGFGTFSRTVRKSRAGRNPKTGTKLVIPAAKVPKFKAGKDFRDLCK